MVKQFLAGPKSRPGQPRNLPVRETANAFGLERLTKKSIVASEEEMLINPRARSARLRAARRIS
jgi:16S rRNA (cytosine1402-N4)-methyltransferase